MKIRTGIVITALGALLVASANADTGYSIIGPSMSMSAAEMSNEVVSLRGEIVFISGHDVSNDRFVLTNASPLQSGLCPEDLDGDGVVSPTDLATMLGWWGTAQEAGDLDGDSVVGPTDLALLLGAWGPCL